MMQRYAAARFAVAFAIVTAVVLSAPAFAQSVNAGDISGLVTDTSGAAIPGATVTVLNINTGVSKDYQTNQDGLYDTSSIVAGTYKLTFSKEGFASMVRSSITVVVGNTTINAQLKIGAVTEAVVVNADVPLLKTENGEQTATLSAETLQQLPQVGQDWSSFSILLPGAAGVPMGAQGTAGSGTSNGTTLSVNGNLPYSTVLSDGAETTLPASANSDINIQETVQEVQISTSAFSAQYGVGGILYNQISKGGTDGFHGSAYEYFQNDALNAYNYAFGQSTSKSVLRYHNFGGSIGGPIIRRKVFFYFDFDKIIQHGGNQAVFYNVPTPAVLAGDFTGYPTLYDPATNRIQATGTYLYPGQSKASTCPCIIRTSFAAEYGNGNRIPASRIDPVAKNIQGYFPASNTAGNLAGNGQVTGNYTYTSPASNPFTKYFGRLDYNISPNNRLTMSVTDGDNPGESFGAGICPINCQSNDVSRVNSQITDVWTISPRITNELRLGYTNQLNFFVPGTLNGGYPGKLGWQFAKADNFPAINIANYNNSNNPNGDTVVTSNINAVYKEHAFDPSDVVTFIVGKHILHFGGEFLIYQNNSTAWGNVNAGSMSYTGQYTSAGFASDLNSSSTGWGYADFLLGQTQQWNARVTPEYGGRMKLPQMFVQDDYKVSPKLTVNLGLRYQIQTGWSEVKGNAASFDPRVPNPATGTLGAMWYDSTKANGRDTIQAPVYNTFLPRVGFAYMIDPKTTVRGGFGLYAYNWSNDTYNGNNISNIMGGAFGGNGSVVDNTSYTPVVVLSQSGANLPYVQSSTNPAAFNGQTVAFAAYHQPVGGSYQWNIQAQRELNNDTVVGLGYVASHGHDLPFPVDINQVPENRLGSGQQFRPYPQFGTIAVAGVVPGENAISNYNSLQATIEKRMTHGLNFNFSYVWSHFLDDLDSSGWGSHAGAQNWQRAYDPHANYGNSNFDIRNAFKGSIVYQLPFGEGKQFLNNNRILDTVIGGWQAASTIIIQSGQPFTPTIAGADGALSLSDPNTHYTWYPNLIGNPVLSGRNTEHWFNEAAFGIPAQATFGNAHRNQLTGPGFNRVNISVGKSFRLYEQYRLQIRADANNAFNHPSFGIPTTDLSAGPNGFVTGTSKIRTVTDPGRTMQLSARFSF